jgi:hypothetical protein
MHICIYICIKIGIIYKEERLKYCVQKIRKFESSGDACRPAPDVYAVRVTTKTPIVYGVDGIDQLANLIKNH